MSGTNAFSFNDLPGSAGQTKGQGIQNTRQQNPRRSLPNWGFDAHATVGPAGSNSKKMTMVNQQSLDTKMDLDESPAFPSMGQPKTDHQFAVKRRMLELQQLQHQSHRQHHRASMSDVTSIPMPQALQQMQQQYSFSENRHTEPSIFLQPFEHSTASRPKEEQTEMGFQAGVHSAADSGDLRTALLELEQTLKKLGRPVQTNTRFNVVMGAIDVVREHRENMESLESLQMKERELAERAERLKKSLEELEKKMMESDPGVKQRAAEVIHRESQTASQTMESLWEKFNLPEAKHGIVEWSICERPIGSFDKAVEQVDLSRCKTLVAYHHRGPSGHPETSILPHLWHEGVPLVYKQMNVWWVANNLDRSGRGFTRGCFMGRTLDGHWLVMDHCVTQLYPMLGKVLEIHTFTHHTRIDKNQAAAVYNMQVKDIMQGSMKIGLRPVLPFHAMTFNDADAVVHPETMGPKRIDYVDGQEYWQSS
eukprot:Clim_evm5s60 gene=Clim_evmTU5s60